MRNAFLVPLGQLLFQFYRYAQDYNQNDFPQHG